MKQQRTERTPEQARQGERGRPVLTVLLASLALLVIAFAVAGLLPVSEPPATGEDLAVTGESTAGQS